MTQANGLDVMQVQAMARAQAEQQKQQQEAMLFAEVRATARELYIAMLGPVLRTYWNVEETHPDPAELRRMASLAAKCAPYLQEAHGMLKVNDAETWK